MRRERECLRKIAIMNAHDLAERGHRIFFLCALLPIAPELKSHPNITVICSEQYEIIADPRRTRAFLQGWWMLRPSELRGSFYLIRCQKYSGSSPYMGQGSFFKCDAGGH